MYPDDAPIDPLKQVLFQGSSKETGGIKDKHINFFKDIDPDIDYFTIFDEKYAHPEGESAIIDLPNTEKEVIDMEVAKMMLESPKKQQAVLPEAGTFQAINQLHNHKGCWQGCELCGKGAALMCARCMVTFYCGWVHVNRDKSHRLVCDKMKIIRWPAPHKNTNVERRRIKAQKMLVMEMLLDDLIYQSYFYIAKKQFRQAMSTLSQCFKYVIPVYSSDHRSSQMITLYTAMTEIYIGMKNKAFAKKTMVSALSILWRDRDNKKDESRMNFIKSLLEKTRGLYYYAKGRFEKALNCFSDHVIFLTEAAGASHIRLCMGFFLLGKTFVALGKNEKGLAIISFCVNMWLYYLVGQMSTVAPDMPAMPKSIYFKSGVGVLMTRIVKLDFIRFFGNIWDYINELDNPTEWVKLHLCEAMMLFLDKKYKQIIEHTDKCAPFFPDAMKDPALMGVWKHMVKLYGRRVRSPLDH